jgi:hypothetical protein
VLRSAVIVIGAIAALCGSILLLLGAPGGFAAFFFGGLLLLGTIFERVIYKPVERGRLGGDWQETTERFIDETTGELVTVWLDPKSGERKYIRS